MARRFDYRGVPGLRAYGVIGPHAANVVAIISAYDAGYARTVLRRIGPQYRMRLLGKREVETLTAHGIREVSPEFSPEFYRMSTFKNPRRTLDEAAEIERRENRASVPYGGYWILLNNLRNELTIEKDGQLIGRVPSWASWDWARQTIDALNGKGPFPSQSPPRKARTRRNPARKQTTTKRKARKVRKNPPRPWDRAGTLSTRAVALTYHHTSDGKLYRHPFAAGVTVELLADGSIRLYRPDRRSLWRMFNR